jgi:transcriptional regulator
VRHNPDYAERDPGVVRRLIAENPWATIVSNGAGGLVASHMPVLLDDSTEDLTVISHVGRPDEQVHALGDGELLVIASGSYGYVSPSWYPEEGPKVPTWNFSVAHCYGVPQLLSEEENLRELARLVHHFEQHVACPVELDPEFGARLAKGTVGFRLPISRFVCKVKMSQDKDEASQQSVLAQLRGNGPYAQPALADDMQRALS